MRDSFGIIALQSPRLRLTEHHPSMVTSPDSTYRTRRVSSVMTGTPSPNHLTLASGLSDFEPAPSCTAQTHMYIPPDPRAMHRSARDGHNERSCLHFAWRSAHANRPRSWHYNAFEGRRAGGFAGKVRRRDPRFTVTLGDQANTQGKKVPKPSQADLPRALPEYHGRSISISAIYVDDRITGGHRNWTIGTTPAGATMIRSSAAPPRA
jgi:hypothetical protein